MTSELRVVGRRVPMIDATDKATGDAGFVSDLKLPGLLYGRILRSPLAHARIISVDTSRAERLPGVKAVIAGRDVPHMKVGEVIPDEPVLAVDRVRYVGDQVAAVAAVSEDAAEEALGLIAVQYEELPVVDDPLQAMEPGAPLLHEAVQNIATRMAFGRGDIAQGFEEANEIVEESFETSLVHQCYLEPMGCVADHSRDTLSWYLPVHIPSIARLTYSKILGLPPEAIRIITPYVGGGFGAKMEYAPHLICALLSRKAGRPVRMFNSRVEEFMATLPRLPMYITLKLGVKRDGRITAKKTKIIADNGAYTHYAPAIVSTAAMRADNQFRLENIETEAYLVYTNKMPTSCFRGFGNPQMTFALAQGVDIVAARLGLDPIEVLLANAVHKGDVTAHGWYMGSCGLEDCIRQSAEAAGWQAKRGQFGEGGERQIAQTPEPHPAPGRTADVSRPAGSRSGRPYVSGRGKARGIGIATCIHVSGNRGFFRAFEGSAAFVRIGDDGKVQLFTGEIDLGQGSRTVFAQMAAEELGLSVQDIKVAMLDTDVSPFGIGTFASRATTLGGKAVIAAARDARAKLGKVAADLLEANQGDLQFRDGRILVQGSPERAVPFLDVARKAVYGNAGGPIVGQGSFVPDNVVVPDAQTKYGNVSIAHPFAAHIAEVEVDTETGRVEVVNYVAAHDVGKTINPLAAEGQLEGGIVQGLGYALTEGIAVKNGKVANPTFVDYKLMTSTDIPPIKCMFIESDDPVGPYGAKSLGEPTVIPVAAAIANAIYNAVGVRIKTLPITAEKVRRALLEKTG
ncbi:MAG: molybdopterin-dependent oxidoreductase [Chloroflexi bacterium]|nr:molybdopterin-dependent oxidoreductase [Chloroflexota bacterium]